MNAQPTCRVRALGTLWTGHETWGERHLATLPADHVTRGPLVPTKGQGVVSVFPDFATVTDYEVVRFTRTLSVLSTSHTARVTRTVTEIVELEETLRAWSLADSEGRWLDLEADSVSPSEEAAVNPHEAAP